MIYALALLVLAATLASPLDERAADGHLTAHVAQHIPIGDLIAPLLLLGLPAATRARLRRACPG